MFLVNNSVQCLTIVSITGLLKGFFLSFTVLLSVHILVILCRFPGQANLAVDTVIKAPCWTEVAASRDWNLFYQVSGPAHTVQSSQRRQPSPRPALRQPGTWPCHLATEITNRSRIALKGHRTYHVSLSHVGFWCEAESPSLSWQSVPLSGHNDACVQSEMSGIYKIIKN